MKTALLSLERINDSPQGDSKDEIKWVISGENCVYCNEAGKSNEERKKETEGEKWEKRHETAIMK